MLIQSDDEIDKEACDKSFCIAKKELKNHNIGIQCDVKAKFEAKNIKVKIVTVERKGHQVHGEFIQCEVEI